MFQLSEHPILKLFEYLKQKLHDSNPFHNNAHRRSSVEMHSWHSIVHNSSPLALDWLPPVMSGKMVYALGGRVGSGSCHFYERRGAVYVSIGQLGSLVPTPPPVPFISFEADDRKKVASIGSNQSHLGTEVHRPGFFLSSDVFFRLWVVKRLPLLRSDFLFRGQKSPFDGLKTSQFLKP